MATYTHNATAVPSGTPWIDVNIDGENPVLPPSSTLVVFLNSDGTFTRIIGTGFTFDGNGEATGGTVTSVERTSTSGGGTVYEVVTGLSLSLVALYNSPGEGNAGAFNLIFAGVDTLNGFGGVDFLYGGPGADTLNGGLGSDYADYSGASAGLVASLGNPAANTGDAAGDSYTSIENLRGSAFNDTLNGDINANILSGGNGFDILRGFGGNDTLIGGDVVAGNGETTAPERWQGARAEYRTDLGVTGSINAVFNSSGATVTSVGGNGGTDTLINVQQVSGTESADTFSVTTDFNGLFGNFAEFEGRGGNDTITGNGINTRISFANASAGVTVNLATQTMSGGGNTGTDTFSGVRQVRGSSQADNLSAVGVQGDIVFIGQGGNDTLTGSGLSVNQRDSALARYDNAATSSITATLSTTSTVTGADVGTDTLVNITHIRGTDFNDTFTVDNSFTSAYGKFVEFQGMDGNDTFTGNGATRVGYGQASGGVNVTLTAGGGGTAVSIGGNDEAQIGNDTFVSGIRQVRGSNYDDILTGSNDAAAERFRGGAGNDIINGGAGTLNSADYADADAGIIATMTSVQDGFGTIDTLSNIEGIRGSEFNDSITGDGNANILGGQNGDDVINGGGGNDILIGDDVPVALDPYGGVFGTGTQFDSGNDTLDGGTGADTMIGGQGNDFYIVDDAGDVVTESAGQGTDTVQTSLSFFSLATRPDVENLTFTNAATFNNGVGNAQANVLTGTSGSESLTGGGGNDTFNAGGGDDFLYIDRFDTAINAGSGFDAIFIQDNANFTLNVGATGAEWVYGWVGNNVLDASTAATGVTMVGEAGADQLIGSAFNDYLYVDSLDTLIDAGAGSNDALFVYVGSGQVATDTTINMATANAEWALGGAANDTLTNLGRNVSVTLSGGGGNDRLTGGLANDYLYGNAGVDTFVVTSNTQFDAILDFANGQDLINVQALGLDNTSLQAIIDAGFDNGAGSTILNFGSGNQLFLYNVAKAQIDTGDFII